MIKFRPQDIPKKHVIRERRMGLWVNYNFQSRNKWYPAGWAQVWSLALFGLPFTTTHTKEMAQGIQTIL